MPSLFVGRLIVFQALVLTAISAFAEITLLATNGGEALLRAPEAFNHAELMNRRALQGSRTCESIVVPPCARQGNRDIVFLVDASESLDPFMFYSQFLDFVQTSWCGFIAGDRNRGAMITFAGEVKTRIPLQQYSAVEWFAAVDAVRADPSVCCSCCTPTAEAFRAARLLLEANPPLSDDTTRFTLIISDGDPWQNPKNTIYTFPKVKPATYRFIKTPQEALALKNLNGQPDSVRLMFLGVPNKAMKPPSIAYFIGTDVLGKKRCIRRRRINQCIKIPATSPLYPITSVPADQYVAVSNSWDVDELISLVSDDLCRPIPSSAPSKAPTTSPTEKPTFDGLDLYVFLDRSKSMQWRAPNCRAAPGSNPSASDLSVCWELFLGFTNDLVNKSSNLVPLRRPGGRQPTRIGWKNEFPGDIRKGLRVWIYGFACTNQQSTPIVERIGERISSWAEFQSAMETARAIIPTGGTCPGAAFERAIGMIMANDLFTRPYKAALLFTDGVFYDQPRPETAAKGFAKFGVMTYALGISIPINGDNKGLTAKEIRDQRTQMLAFVNGKSERYLNFGAEGYTILPDIATSFVTQLPEDAEEQLLAAGDRPWFCGWSSAQRCLSTNPETFDTSLYCKWIPNDPSNFNGRGRCMDKDWCSWTTKATCVADSHCAWQDKKCEFKGW